MILKQAVRVFQAMKLTMKKINLIDCKSSKIVVFHIILPILLQMKKKKYHCKSKDHKA